MAVAGGLVKKRRSKAQFKEPEQSNSYLDRGSGRVIQIAGTKQVAMEYNPKEHAHLPEGFCVINIQTGNKPEEMAPVQVTWFDWEIWIPRGTDRIVPLHHVRILNDAVKTEYRQPVYGEDLDAIPSKVHPFTVKKWPKAEAGVFHKEEIQAAQQEYDKIDVDQ